MTGPEYAETAKKAEEKEEENKRAMGRVLGDLSHTREKLRVGEEEKKVLEAEVGAVRAELMQAEKEKEAEDVEMGGTCSPSQKTRVDDGKSDLFLAYSFGASRRFGDLQKGELLGLCYKISP